MERLSAAIFIIGVICLLIACGGTLAQASPPELIKGKDDAQMVLIPAGEFQMGTDSKDIPQLVQWARSLFPLELQPPASWLEQEFEREVRQSAVYLDAFYIDVYEVTNAQYKKFMDATGHQAPGSWDDTNFNAPDQPVVDVTWFDAVAYAQWAGKRLPTDAEWEKAARGGLVGKQYSWGDEPPDGTQCNFNDQDTTTNILYGADVNDGYQHTAPVGSFPPNGYGLYDMAGNVQEWCEEWTSSIITTTDWANPGYRRMRGEAWQSLTFPSHMIFLDLRVTTRSGGLPEWGFANYGFRCAKDVNPSSDASSAQNKAATETDAKPKTENTMTTGTPGDEDKMASGTVQGQIIEGNSLTPWRDFPEERSNPEVTVVLVRSGGGRYETKTDSHGNYKLSDIPPGRYLLSYHKAGSGGRSNKPVTVVAGKVHNERLQEMRRTTNPDASVYINQGDTYAEQGKLDKTIREYKKAVRIDPDAAETHFRLGTAYLRQEKLKEAIGLLKTAIRLDPYNPGGYGMLGTAYLNQGESDKAIAEYKTAIRINPNLADGHVSLGLAYSSQDKLGKAITEFKTALSITPNLVGAHYNTARAYSLKKERILAVESLQKAFTLDRRMIEVANADDAFDDIRESPEFQQLITSNSN